MTGRCLTFWACAIALSAVLGMGCNKTTREDVTAARNKVNREERKLDEMKREDARAIKEEKDEAKEARTTNKPIVGDDPNEGVVEEEREARQEAERARQREAKQAEKVADAKREAKTTEDKLAGQVERDKFAADARMHIDHANRSIEKLQANRNAADDDGKKAIDDQIKQLKDKRDFLEKKIDDMEAADAQRWQDHKDAASKAAAELHELANKVS